MLGIGTKRSYLLAMAGVGLMLLTSCGDAEGAGDSSTEQAASPPDSAERYSTVLDEAMEAIEEPLPETTVAFGGNEIEFSAEEPLKIAFHGYGRGFDYAAPEYVAADDFANDYDHVEIDQFDPAGDPQVQIQQIQDTMSSGDYNAMVVYPLSTSLLCDLMTRQMPEAGIMPVAIGNPPCAEDDQEGTLTIIPDTGGTDYVYPAWAQIIAEREAGGRGVLLTGPEIDYTSQMAQAAIEESFAAQDIELLAVQRTDFTQDDSLQKAQDIISAHPDVTTVVSSYPEGTHALVTALRTAGLTDDVTVYDFGGEIRTLEQIETGLVDGSSPFYPYSKTKTAFQALMLARAGEPVESYIPYSGRAQEPEDIRREGADIAFIDEDNVEMFIDEIAEY